MDPSEATPPQAGGTVSGVAARRRDIGRIVQHVQDLGWKLLRRMQRWESARRSRPEHTWVDEAHIDARIEAGDPIAAIDAIRDASQRLAETADQLERVLIG